MSAKSEVANYDSSQAALKAINKIADSEFQTLQVLATQMAWSSFFFTGTDIETPQKGVYQTIDPRNLYYQTKSSETPNTTYINFCYTYHPEYEIVYIDPATSKYLSASFDTINSKLSGGSIKDFTTGELESLDQNLICSYIAGLVYLNKSDAFVKIYGQTIKDAIKLIKAKYEATISPYLTKLEQRFKKTKDELKSSNLGFFCYSASFCPASIKEQYASSKKSYESKVNELYEILKQSSSLTVCYQSASIGDASISDDSNDNMIYTNINQVLKCCEDEVAEQTANETETARYEDLLNQIQDLKVKVVVKDDIYKMIDEKISAIQTRESIINTSTSSISIALIIVIIVLFIMSLGNFGFTLSRTKQNFN